MRWKTYSGMILGSIAIALGILWFLQGSGVMHLCPILCFVDCACVIGKSLFWELLGIIIFFCGVLLFVFSCKHLFAWINRKKIPKNKILKK